MLTPSCSIRIFLALVRLCAFWTCCAVLPGTAQEPYYLRRIINRGLPSNVIKTILPSRTGVVWIVTSQGMCTFDGAVIRTVPAPNNADIRLLLPSIETCAEDSTGGLWFGSDKGLIRYTLHDGLWQRFLPDAELSEECSFVSTLVCDHTGALWIGTRGGLLRFDPKGRRCIMATPLLRNNGVYHLHEDAHGHLWVGAWEEPPICFDIARQEWLRMQPSVAEALITPKARAPANKLSSVRDGWYYHEIADAEGCLLSPIIPNSLRTQAPMRAVVKERSIIWQSSPSAPCGNLAEGFQKGVATYLWAEENKTKTVEKKTEGNNGFVWVEVNIRASSELASRRVSGLYAVSSDATVLPIEPMVRGVITAVRRDRRGRLWVGTEGNGCVMLLPTGLERLSNHADIGSATAIIRDRRGRLWCGTDRGVMMRSAEDTAVWQRVPMRFPADPSAPRSAKLSVREIYETPQSGTPQSGTLQSGRILVGSSAGLGEFDEQRKSIIPLAGFYRTVARTLANGTGERDLTVKKILSDRTDSSLWLVMPRIGVVHCAKDGRELQRWEQRSINDPNDVQKLSSATVFSLYQDHEGRIWIGTLNGIDRWNPATKRLEHLSHLQTQGGTSNSERILTVTAFTETLEAKASESAVTAVAYGSGLIERIATPQARFLPLPPLVQETQILGLAGIADEYWWSTYTNMVARARKRDGRLVIEEILPSDVSSLGSLAFDPPDDHVANAGTMHQSTWGSVLHVAAKPFNELLFDYNGDALRLLPGKVRAFADTSHVVPMAWYRNDTLMGGAPKGTGDTLTVPMNASFGVECSVVSMARPERHRLQYRLEGLERAWSLAPTSTERMIRYAAMPPGVYRLVIRSCVHDGLPPDSSRTLGNANSEMEGQFSDNTLVIMILVPTPWYLMLWVQVLAGAVVMVGGGMMIRSLERKRAEKRSLERLLKEQEARKQEQIERSLVEFQLKTLRLQMDPHFIFNALTVLQELTLQNQEQAADYIAIFADILRKTLEQSGKHTISVREECTLLDRYMQLEEMRNEWKLDYEFHLIAPNDSAPRWDVLHIPPFIVQPYLENAIRHGIRPMLQTNATVRRRGKIRVELRDEGTYLRCTVEDNGIGRAESDRIKLARRAVNPHLSIATKVTAERLRLLQEVYKLHLNVSTEDLTDENGVAAGTRVTVLVPFHVE
jgi:ligand-binding sensor domain-containing protein